MSYFLIRAYYTLHITVDTTVLSDNQLGVVITVTEFKDRAIADAIYEALLYRLTLVHRSDAAETDALSKQLNFGKSKDERTWVHVGPFDL